MTLSFSLPQIKMPNGVVVWEGTSQLNGKPIVVIATGFNGTANPKTGDMIQVWILPGRMNPVKAWVSGKDDSVCGNCKHSSIKNGGYGTCYVGVFQAPTNIWKAWKKGNYPTLTDDLMWLFKGQNIRLGAYGDPAAVPTAVWEKITKESSGWTGYTHQWNNANIDPNLKMFCMASVDSPVEMESARAQNWRTFRVRLDHTDPVLDKEFVCPASEEGGKRLTCAECKACRGGEFNGGKGTVAIIIHGRKYKVKRFRNIMKLRRGKKSYRHLLSQK